MRSETGAARARFRAAYARHREREGRGRGGVEELLALPYLRSGRWAKQWHVRARTYEHFIATVLGPRERTSRRLRILDLGAGNGWLSFRLQKRGHVAVAVDWRDDVVDGLGAARGYREHLDTLFPRVAASFDELPFADTSYDLALFNASLHYATDLASTLGDAARVLAPGGAIVILDSPFYRDARDGEAMVAEKRSRAPIEMGPDGDHLLGLASIEYLTRERLEAASRHLGFEWKRHRVRYPLWYELRPVWAALRRRRAPSRFDVWQGTRSTTPR
jgi:SAM-dependent methyltransferase